MKRVWLIGVLAVCALAAAAWWYVSRLSHPSSDVSTAPAVDVATVKAGTFMQHVSAQGRVGPPAGSSAKIAFAQSGIVRSVDVRVGDRVLAGTPLAELDQAPLAAALNQAQADAASAASSYGEGALPAAALGSARAKLAVAQARLANLEAHGPASQSEQIAAQTALRQADLKLATDRTALDRARTLFGGGVIAEKDLAAAQSQLQIDQSDLASAQARAAAAAAGFTASLASARADYATAKSDLRTAQSQSPILKAQRDGAAARLEAARLAYNAAILRAPADGVVIAILKHPGEAVDPASPAIEIGPVAARTVTLTVPAQSAQQITKGARVELRLARSGLREAGTVSAVVPVVDPLTQAATVTVSGAPVNAVPGDAVEATIDIGLRHGLLVPAAAVVEDPQSGKALVFVQTSSGSFVSREVSVTASDATTALIDRGVRAGERVATRGSYELLAPPGG
jgi:multidrug efflux pump subunit AcrA (membrane-fusion protein)